MIVIFVLILVFVITITIGVPIYAAIGTATVVSLMTYDDFSLTIVPQTFFTGIDSFVLIAVALFIISGSLMKASGMTDDIFEVADSVIGHISGGVGASAIVAGGIFGALTGSGLAATVAIGSVAIGGMVQRGYEKPLAGAVTASGGALGVLIPPSNPMIIYGVISGTSIGSLFLAGILPGIFVTLSLAFVMYLIGKKRNLKGSGIDFSFKRMLKAMWKGKWGLFAPIIILGSIYSGFATPTEAAEIAVLYALFYGVVISKNVKIKELVVAFKNGALTASIMLVMTGAASGFGNLITLYQLPQKIGALIATITTNPQIVLLMILLLLLFTGMFMETLSQIIILTPIFLPVVTELGVDPVFFGIFFILSIEIGFLTPPIGGNLFVASKLSDSTILEVSKEEIPFIAVFLLWAILLIFFPGIVTFLPDLII